MLTKETEMETRDTDIPDVDQVENVICVNHQDCGENIDNIQELNHEIKVEPNEQDYNIHSVNVTAASTTTGIITIPVVGSLSPCPYSVIDSDSVVTPISVAINSDGSLIQSQQQQQQQQVQSHPILTWEEAVSAEILPVRCKDTNAELHKSRFGSGNKGKCIKGGNEWYTPTEFESICGRGNSKDWKRSIRFGGRTLQTLIDKKFLIPHASSCICSCCVDDATATGPIRPFTPYQRKRKVRNNDTLKGIKLERLTSKDSTTDESDLGTPVTPGGSGLNPLTQALTQSLIKINQPSLPACNSEAWKTMEDAVEKLVSASLLLKSMLQEMKERTNNELDSLRTQLNESSQNLQQALNQAQQTQQVTISRTLEPQILRIFDSNRLQAYSIEVLDAETFKQLQVTQPTVNNSPKVSIADTVLPPISQLF